MVSPGMNAKKREQPRSSAEDRADNSQHPPASRHNGDDIAAPRGEFEGVVGPRTRGDAPNLNPSPPFRGEREGTHCGAMGRVRWVPASAVESPTSPQLSTPGGGDRVTGGGSVASRARGEIDARRGAKPWLSSVLTVTPATARDSEGPRQPPKPCGPGRTRRYGAFVGTAQRLHPGDNVFTRHPRPASPSRKPSSIAAICHS
jgi:hypothetical protein